MQSRAMAKPLHQLSPRHHQAVALGWWASRPQAIADSLGVERRTVYLWFSDPLVKEEVERRSRDVAKLITERLADHTLAALDRLGEIIDLPLDTEVADRGTEARGDPGDPGPLRLPVRLHRRNAYATDQVSRSGAAMADPEVPGR